MSEDVEKTIKDLGCDKRPRITPEYLRGLVRSVAYLSGSQAIQQSEHEIKDPIITQALNSLTLCVVVLKNGFTLVGKSACVFPENYNMIIGRRIALDDAMRQIGAYEGYVLAEQRWLGLNDPLWKDKVAAERGGQKPTFSFSDTSSQPLQGPFTLEGKNR